MRAAIGPWRLGEVGGKVECTLSLTDRTIPGGRDLTVPAACHRAFPPLKDISAWGLDPQGAIVFSNAAGRVVVAFSGAAGGPSQATAPDGKVWRIEPTGALKPLRPPVSMRGVFRLSGPGGADLCELALSPDIFGGSGSIRVDRCDAGWANRGFWAWTFKRGFLTFVDKAGKPILVLKAGDTGVFAGEGWAPDPKRLTQTAAKADNPHHSQDARNSRLDPPSIQERP